jgi:hypothetical protein
MWRSFDIRLLVCGALLLCSFVPVGRSASLSADTNKPNISTYVAGEPAEISFSISGLESNQSSTLDLTLLDEYGNSSSPPQALEITADEHGNATGSVALPTQKLGYYELHARLADGTTLPAVGTRPSGFISYAVVPDPARRTDYGDEGSRFGLQGGFNASANIISYLGVRYVLQDGAGWGELEPDYAGEYDIARRLARSNGLLLPAPNPAVHSPLFDGKPWQTYDVTLVSRATVPPWALRRGTAGTTCKAFGALNASSERSLKNFAAATATAFRSDYSSQHKRYYQVTWEPAAGWCFRGSAADLVKMYALVYAAIHAADPGAVVAGPTLFSDQKSTAQLRELWQAGLGRYIDAFSIHPYTAWPPEAERGLVSTLRLQLAEARQAVGHTMSFIGTEHGYTSGALGNLRKALGDIRSSLMMLGEGAQIDFGFYAADYWEGPDPAKDEGYGYYWNLNPRISWGTDKLGPKAVVPAYAAMTYFLDGSTSDGPLTDLRAGQVGYRFHKPDGSSIRAIWDPQGSTTYLIGSGALVCDWMGNCLPRSESNSMVDIGQAPTYIIDER